MALCEEQKKAVVLRLKEVLKDVSKEEVESVVKEALRKDPTPEEVKEKQMAPFIKLGYPAAMGLTEEGFKKIVPLPEDRPGALLVVSERAVGLYKQMQLIGGVSYLDPDSIEDVVQTPRKLIYWIYGVENGKAMLGKSPDDCLKIFKKQGRRGLTSVEGIALSVQGQVDLRDHYVDLPGSRYGAESVPVLGRYDGQPELYYYWSDSAYSDYGSASCGS